MLATLAARRCSNAVGGTVATTAMAEAEVTTASTGTGADTGTGVGAARAESASRGCLRLIASTNNCFLTFRVFPFFSFPPPHPVCPSCSFTRFSLKVLA